MGAKPPFCKGCQQLCAPTDFDGVTHNGRWRRHSYCRACMVVHLAERAAHQQARQHARRARQRAERIAVCETLGISLKVGRPMSRRSHHDNGYNNESLLEDLAAQFGAFVAFLDQGMTPTQAGEEAELDLAEQWGQPGMVDLLRDWLRRRATL